MQTRRHRERMMTPSGLAVDARRYAGSWSRGDPRISPLFAKLDSLPPLLIQVGDDEVLLDDSKRLAEAAHAAGVAVTVQVWPGLWHVWHLYAGLVPEADAALQVIADFIADQVGSVG